MRARKERKPNRATLHFHAPSFFYENRFVARLSPTILPLQLPPNILFTIFYYLPPKDSAPYNSFSPTIPPIYYHSLTNYLFNVFKFKKIIQYLYYHNMHYHHVTGLKQD